MYNKGEDFIYGKEDSDIYPIGRYETGSRMIEEYLDCIRRKAEACSSLQGFNVFSSINGGTGSGFGALLYENLSDVYPSQ